MTLNMMLHSKNNKTSANILRKARTRTLIQLGGLIDKVGLSTIFNINLGDDLQEDISAIEKAATLYGFLIEAYHKKNDDADDMNRWQELGLKYLKSEVSNK
jgi:hypothetical protein